MHGEQAQKKTKAQRVERESAKIITSSDFVFLAEGNLEKEIFRRDISIRLLVVP